MLNVNHFGFQPGDSCECQLLSIVHNIYAGFDQNHPLEVCSCFLDISKAFDKVWHEGLIYKMETMSFTGSSILSLLQSFLKLVSTIFYQIFIFSSNDRPSKTMKNDFFSSKNLFSFSRYLHFFIFSLLFHIFQIQKGKWKWNNLCYKLACINLQI